MTSGGPTVKTAQACLTPSGSIRCTAGTRPPATPEHGITDYQEYQGWPSERRAIADLIADRVQNQAVLTDTDFGVAKYGAILYQIARKFFQARGPSPTWRSSPRRATT